MNKIKEYLEFAIKNGYKWLPKWTRIKELRIFIDEQEVFETWSLNTVSALDTIVDKWFIEAIARGIDKSIWFNNIIKWTFFDWFVIKDRNIHIDMLTYIQSLHIRDGTLDKFITNLLWKI